MSVLNAAQTKSIKSMIKQDIHSRSAGRKGLSTDIKTNTTLTRVQEKFPNLDGVIDRATIKKLIKEVREELVDNTSDDYEEVLGDYEVDTNKRKKLPKKSSYTTGKFSDDVIIGLRDIDAPNKKKESHSIWAELAELLPLRNPKAIYQHANRRFTMKSQTPWTQEDKERLKQLVGDKGNKWSEIGRIMGRLGDDCKHVFRRFRERTKKGRFTEEEDNHLTQAVREVMEIGGDVRNQDLPTQDIPWIQVAQKMNNERLDIDYLRRWQTVKSSFTIADMQSDILVSSEPLKKKKVHIYSNSKGNDVAYKIVRYLGGDFSSGFKYEDESHVIWADIDRMFNLPYAFSAHKWRFLQSDLPIELKSAPFQDRIQYFLNKYEKLVDPSTIGSGLAQGSSSNNNSGAVEDDDDTSEDEEEPQPQKKAKK